MHILLWLDEKDETISVYGDDCHTCPTSTMTLRRKVFPRQQSTSIGIRSYPCALHEKGVEVAVLVANTNVLRPSFVLRITRCSSKCWGSAWFHMQNFYHWSVSVLCDDSNRVKNIPPLHIKSQDSSCQITRTLAKCPAQGYIMRCLPISWQNPIIMQFGMISLQRRYCRKTLISNHSFSLHILLIIYTALDWRGFMMALNHVMWPGRHNVELLNLFCHPSDTGGFLLQGRAST